MRPSPLLLAIVSALSACGSEKTMCITVDTDAQSCPAAADVAKADLFDPGDCNEQVVTKITTEGELTSIGYLPDMQTPACCYTVLAYQKDPTSQCVIGRPFDGDLHAEVVHEGGALDRVAQAWIAAASGEHASVAAFARLSMELMAHGAPMDLLRDAHAAALDEVEHTELCLSVARRMGAVGARMGSFPFRAPVTPARSLVDIAVDAVREGCLVETLGAHVAAVAAGACEDADLAALLASIADDEARHAVLSWRVVAWAMSVGGEEVRRAVYDALVAPVDRMDTSSIALRSGIDEAWFERVIVSGVDEVLSPAAQALWAA